MNWKQDNLDATAAFIGRGKSPVYVQESSYLVLNQACIQHGYLDLSRLKCVSKEHFERLEAYQKTQAGDIFVNSTGTGTLGRIGFWKANDSIAFDSHVTLVRLKAGFDSRYFYYWLHMPEAQRQIERDCITGSTNQVELSREAFRRILVCYPNQQEQQSAIAHVLATVDRAIEQSEALIAKHRRIKTGLMHDLLTRGIDERGELRDPATHRFKPSPLGMIPVEWDVASLGQQVKQFQGIIQTGPFGSQLHAHEYSSEGIPVIMPQDMRPDGTLDLESAARIPKRRALDLHRHFVKANDVVFARRGDLSRCVPISVDKSAICGTGCLLVRMPSSVIYSDFLAEMYKHDHCQRQILARAVGSTMVNLNTSLLEDLLIAKPGIEEQQLIAQQIKSIRSSIYSEELFIEKLHKLKTGLMQDLLTGAVSVAPLLDALPFEEAELPTTM